MNENIEFKEFNDVSEIKNFDDLLGFFAFYLNYSRKALEALRRSRPQYEALLRDPILDISDILYLTTEALNRFDEKYDPGKANVQNDREFFYKITHSLLRAVYAEKLKSLQRPDDIAAFQTRFKELSENALELTEADPVLDEVQYQQEYEPTLPGTVSLELVAIIIEDMIRIIYRCQDSRALDFFQSNIVEGRSIEEIGRENGVSKESISVRMRTKVWKNKDRESLHSRLRNYCLKNYRTDYIGEYDILSFRALVLQLLEDMSIDIDDKGHSTEGCNPYYYKVKHGALRKIENAILGRKMQLGANQ